MTLRDVISTRLTGPAGFPSQGNDEDGASSSKLQFGLSLHTVTTDLSEKGLSIFRHSLVKLVEIKQSLFDHDNHDHNKARLRHFIQESGISAPTVHATFGDPFDWSSTDPQVRQIAMKTMHEAIKLAEYFNAGIVVMHASAEPIAPADRPERVRLAKQSLLQIQEWAQQHGRRVAVEYLPRTCLGNSVPELLELLSGLDEKTVGICLDTNHLMDQSEHLPEIVRRLGSRIISLHLSDYDGVDEQHWVPGRGVVDWGAFMQALRDIQYQGPFILECSFRPKERLMMLCDSYAWLSGL